MPDEAQALAHALVKRYRVPCMFRVAEICKPHAQTYPLDWAEPLDNDNPMGGPVIVRQCAVGCAACLKWMRNPRMSPFERACRIAFATLATTEWRIEHGDLQTKLSTGVI
jgi:hypothetical protein